MAKAKSKKIKVLLKRSACGRTEYQQAVLKGLGLKKINNCVELPDKPEIRGMIEKVKHLLEVQE